MLGIRLDPDLEKRLERLAKQTGRSKSYYAKLAIRQYLEDREDYLLGIAALERKEPRISLKQLERLRTSPGGAKYRSPARSQRRRAG
jgi:RHH-type transcriptional regulator, rel operon repressor / antitoxin RelB